MEELSNPISFDLPKNRSNVIKVIGVGGGGSNAINHMFQQGIVGVDFVVCNTDAQALEKSSVPIKIQLGASLTEGLGAGANPDVGRQAAQESYEELKTLLSTQTKMVFITAGMGGGTGTGAAPIIAKMAKEMDVLTVGIVTMPFQFEGKIRLEQAQKGLENLKNNVDALIVINNNKLREVYGNLGFKAGFSKADEVLATAARGIAEVITHHYTQNIDLKDAKTVLTNSGSAIMGSATASGANRAQEAIVKALDSPLLNDNKITGCKNVLLLIVSGKEEITIDEIGEINDFIQTEAGNNTNIIMGVGEDDTLEESISVTIIATGFNSDQQHEIVNTEARRVIHSLEEDQPLVQDLIQPETPPVVPSEPINTFAEQPVVKYVLEEDDFAKEKLVKEVEPENSLIALTEEILAMEVTYSHVKPEAPAVAEVTSHEEISQTVEAEEEFIFNDITASLRDMEVVDPETVRPEEESQIAFNFDLPLVKETSSEPQKIEEDTPSKQEESVVFHLEEEPTNQENAVETSFELSHDITLKKAPSENDSLPKEETKVAENIEGKAAEPKVAEHPFDQTIRESIQLQNQKRKAQLKQFNYTFKNNLNRIEEMEKQPAYKRLGFDLDEPSQEKPSSTLSLDKDSNDEIQLRSNNSFLHDNVD